MTRRATFTQAELARAIKAADAAGKVARWTPGEITFVDPAMIAQTDTRAESDSPDDILARWREQNAGQAQGH